MSGYREALEAAGAQVLAFEEFGSYQGDWWAKVAFDGKSGWINGSYGSCSVCDAFQAEIGWGDDGCSAHSYDRQESCADCAVMTADYKRRVAEFGREYLDDVLTQEQAETKAAENLEWDGDAQSMVDFIKANAEQS